MDPVGKQKAEQFLQQKMNMLQEMKRNNVSDSTIESEKAKIKKIYYEMMVEAGAMTEDEARQAYEQDIDSKNTNDTNRMRRHGVSEVTIGHVQEENQKDFENFSNAISRIRK